MDILDEIINSKKIDVKIIKEKIEDIGQIGAHTLSLEVDLLTNNYKKVSQCKLDYKNDKSKIIDESNCDYQSNRKKNVFSKDRTFKDYLRQKDNFIVIGEIKRGSPSKGLFAENLSVKSTLENYIDAGIKCISVLTNNQYFYGSYRDLYQVRNNYKGYILNKEFIIDEIQIDIASKMGADIILLIASAISKSKLEELYRYAVSKELDVLVEVHSKLELEYVLSFGAKIIGINNRDLKTFKTNISTSLELISSVSESDLERCLFISESGIKSEEEIKKLRDAGFSGVLIGESLICAREDIATVIGDYK